MFYFFTVFPLKMPGWVPGPVWNPLIYTIKCLMNPMSNFLAASWWAGERWEGQCGASRVCQRDSSADSGSLPWHPGASRQCPWGIIMTRTDTRPTRRSKPRSQAQPVQGIMGMNKSMKGETRTGTFGAPFYKNKNWTELVSQLFLFRSSGSCLHSSSHCLFTFGIHFSVTLLAGFWDISA